MLELSSKHLSEEGKKGGGREGVGRAHTQNLGGTTAHICIHAKT